LNIHGECLGANDSCGYIVEKVFFFKGLIVKNVSISRVGLWSLGTFDHFNVIPRGATRYIIEEIVHPKMVWQW
jgi:hypothetical protein